MNRFGGTIDLTESLFHSLSKDIAVYGSAPTAEFWAYVGQQHNKWARECLKELQALAKKKPKRKC